MSGTETIKLTVLGEPLAQKRHRHASRDRNGRPLPFVMTYDPSEKDKQSLREVVQSKAPDKPLQGPLRVDLYLYYARLKGHYGTGKNAGKVKDSAPLWKITKPDRDNADKIVLDSLNKIFWIDDAQVCDGRILKQYSEKPRTEIYITQLDNQKQLFE